MEYSEIGGQQLSFKFLVFELYYICQHLSGQLWFDIYNACCPTHIERSKPPSKKHGGLSYSLTNWLNQTITAT